MFTVEQMPAQIPARWLRQLADVSTGTIGHFRDKGFMDCGIAARLAGHRIVGTAVTIKLTVPDSIITHYALKHLRVGDVLVFERGDDQNVACWGGMTSAAAAKLGVAGVVIDGAGHDVAAAAKVGLPIWCRRISAVTTRYRKLGGALNAPVICGGVLVSPGDAILADDNGVLVISPDEVEETVAQAKNFDAKKAEILAAITQDPTFSVPDASGATAIVEEALAAGRIASGE